MVREAGPRRAGAGALRRVLLDGAGRPPLGSGLEGAVLRILTRAGLPDPRRQVDLGAGEWIGRVDFLFENERLVVEVDGAWCHEGALDVRRDKLRTAALVAAGFRVLPIPEELVRTQPAEVVRLVRDALRRAA